MASAFLSAAHRQDMGNSAPPRPQISFSLEVVKGKTDHPRRPLPLGRLSIGSGPKCWLRIGGGDVPDIHSWLEVNRNEVELYVFEETPRVQVNGKLVRFAILRGGESLMIGGCEFALHCDRDSVTGTRPFRAPHLSPRQIETLSTGTDGPLSSLSAAELVDKIDEDLRLIDGEDRAERRGWNNLLQAVKNTRAEMPAVSEPAPLSIEHHLPNDPIAIGEELERVVSQVEALTRSLQTRSDRLEQRESGYRESAATLLETQQKLAEQMQLLVAALDRHDDASNDQPRKASA